ncbi:MAG: peptide/nickel transport system permease protein [Thermotogaceae bacterium]|nr:peptide/nickel transport system permease protein [Thermotogaceae bacterium]MDN5337142.1 peptide/nickel transport system permease protein [Thermotogaceae bacterium]
MISEDISYEQLKEEIRKLKRKRSSQANLVWKRFTKNKLALIGFIMVSIIIFMAIFAPLIAPYDPYKTSPLERFKPPSKEHLLGTDALGRDVFSRLIYGSRIALEIGILIVLFEGIIGISLGLVSGYFGGIVDKLIMWLVDVLRSFPIVVLALAIAGVLGQGILNVVIALGTVGWTSYARMVRSKVLTIKELEYIEAAKSIGESNLAIIFRHVLPNVLSTAIVMVCLMMPTALIASATLSFLGLGVQPPTADWGSIIAEGRRYLLKAPWISTSAGFFIMFTVLGFNFIGDGLRDALDPTSRRN